MVRWRGVMNILTGSVLTAVKMEELISMVVHFYFTRKSTEVVL
jgi:hypothetical protein